MRRMRQPGQCGYSIDGRVENQFRPLRRSRIRQSFGFEATSVDQVSSISYHRVRSMTRLEGTDPGCGIEFILHMSIAVLRAAHESGPSNNLPRRMSGNNFLASQPVLRRNDCAPVKTVADE